MTEEADDFELERGTGNVFADSGLPDAEREQLRAVLAAKLARAWPTTSFRCAMPSA